MSSMYSLPARDDDRHHLDGIPLRDFNQPQQNEHIERIEQKETSKKRRKYKWSIYTLGALLFVTTILALAFAGLYVSYRNKLPETPNNGTVLTSTVTTTKSIPGKASTRTQTLPPLTQTTVHTETVVSHTITEITKTSVFTTTDITSITVTQSSEPKRCNNNQQYGGQELHDINGDYDLLLVDAVQNAVSHGLDIGGAEVLDVAVRSVFRCTSSPAIELVEACESGFEHHGGGVVCNSAGSHTTRVHTLTEMRYKH